LVGPSLQSQLQQLSKEKENIAGAMQALDVELSKSKITLEFLQKELSSLEQEKLHLDLELKKASTESPDDFWKDLLAEEDRVKKEVDVLAKQISNLENLFKAKNEQEGQKQKELKAMEEGYRNKQDELSRLKDQISLVNIEKAKVDTQMEVLVQEISGALGSVVLEEIKSVKIDSQTSDLETKIIKLKNQLDMVGGIDELTMKEYQETEVRYTSLSGQVEDLKNGMADLRGIMEELDEHIKTKFNQAFHKINEKFEHYFRILFNGGRAYLSLLKADEPQAEEAESSEDQDTEPKEQLRPEEKIVQKYEKGASNIMGIDIKATPPNKKLSNIQALSGGERALTSIALLCSLLTCFPSPFVVLDEVDAALDDANTIRFGQILGTLAHQTQFITITHNRETMSQA
jgi:chromosome segregation protein